MSFFVWLLIVVVALVVGYFIGRFVAGKRFLEWEKKIREDAVKRSRSVLKGQFSEQLAPYLPGFVWSPNEARFIGKPIDFIIFKGLDDKNVEEIIFLEVKTGNSRLNSAERSLKKVVDEKRVRWEELRINLD